MFVPCPHCGFLVALIVSRGGQAQLCPRCRQSLADDEDAGAEPMPLAASAPIGSSDGPLLRPTGIAATPPHAARAGARSMPAGAVAAPGPLRRLRKHRAPSFARTAAPAGPAGGRRWPGLLAIAGLALLLAVQLLLAQRDELAASERWRPLLGGVCDVLGCELPAWREPDAYTMLARSVQPAGEPGVLRVEASFRNDARWPQPWPALLLSLSDVRGRPVAQRTFAPDEYRDRRSGTAVQLAPGQSASVRFDVVEPVEPIVAFTFDFQ